MAQLEPFGSRWGMLAGSFSMEVVVDMAVEAAAWDEEDSEVDVVAEAIDLVGLEGAITCCKLICWWGKVDVRGRI